LQNRREKIFFSLSLSLFFFLFCLFVFFSFEFFRPSSSHYVQLRGDCRHVDTCNSPNVAVASASNLVSGCDAQLESNGVLCCIDDAVSQQAPLVTPSPTEAPQLPSGRSCSAYGVTGVCLDRNACPSGTTAQAYRRGVIEGCQNEPFNIRCCSAGKPAALPPGKTCVGYGRTGTCLRTSQCKSPYTSHRYRRGYVEGCENEDDDVRCCSIGIAPMDALPPIAAVPPRAGAITPCQTAALLQRAGVPSTYLHKLVCTAKYESTFNCNAQNLRNGDGSGDYGLFQANSRWWCTGGRGRNSGNGCRVGCLSLVGNCEEAARCAATILRTHRGGPPASMTAWVAYTSHRSECDSYRVPPSCGVSLLADEDGNQIEVFSGAENEVDVSGTTPLNGETDNALAIGLGVGIPVALICIVAIVVALVCMARPRSFDVESAVPTAPPQTQTFSSARSARNEVPMQSSRSNRAAY
jgi:lysozyme